MRTILALITISLVVNGYGICGGTAKTFDGKQMPKDSVAEFQLCTQKGRTSSDSTMLVYAVKIDTLSVSMILHGVKDDYSQAERPGNPSTGWGYDKAGAEFAESYQLRRVMLSPGPHELTVRCAGSFLRPKGIRDFVTEPFRMPLTVKAKHRYSFDVKYSEPTWLVTIEDKTTKTVVATLSVKSKLP